MTEYCGAGQRLNVYELNSALSTSSTTASTSTLPDSSTISESSTSTTSTSSTRTSISSSLLKSTSSSSFLSLAQPITTPTTTTSTSSGSSVHPSFQTLSSSTSTSKSSTSSSVPPAFYTGPPVPSDGNVNFTAYNCVVEPVAGRLLSSQVDNNGTSMTIEKCLADCWMYAYAGVEYGRECWCGNSLNWAGDIGNRTPGKNLTDFPRGSDCGFLCPGNSSEYCGSGGKLSLFWFDTAKAAANSKMKD